MNIFDVSEERAEISEFLCFNSTALARVTSKEVLYRNFSNEKHCLTFLGFSLTLHHISVQDSCIRVSSFVPSIMQLRQFRVLQ